MENKLKIPKELKKRTHFKRNELGLLLNENSLPNLVETKQYSLKGKHYTWTGIDNYRMVKFLSSSLIQPVNSGTEKFYSKEKVETLFSQLSSLTLEEWKELTQ